MRELAGPGSGINLYPEAEWAFDLAEIRKVAEDTHTRIMMAFSLQLHYPALVFPVSALSLFFDAAAAPAVLTARLQLGAVFILALCLCPTSVARSTVHHGNYQPQK